MASKAKYQGMNDRQKGPGTGLKSLSGDPMTSAPITPSGNTTSGSSQGHKRGKQG